MFVGQSNGYDIYRCMYRKRNYMLIAVNRADESHRKHTHTHTFYSLNVFLIKMTETPMYWRWNVSEA